MFDHRESFIYGQGCQRSRDLCNYRAAMSVHRELGPGFLEAVYQASLEKEFQLLGIDYNREVKVPVYYKGFKLDTFYKADFVCFDSVVVEVKALTQLSGNETAQILNYLKATDLTKGLLLNFGTPCLQQKRIIQSIKSNQSA